ncbi:MAG: T9SS type A sorting domain-containing protein [Ignavibacteriaceae bacterium]|nr:T9SS type A sorting domain-containing protein [Ignavibacteriaceae bacterium]
MDAQYTNMVQNDSTLTDTTNTVIGLSYLTKYFWRVRASNQTGWGDWSEVWNTTTIIEKPANFTLSTPANFSKGLLNPVTVTWNSSARAEKYILQISTDSTFATFVVNDSTQTDLTEALPTLNNYTQHYWRVKSVNVGGQSDWTSTWNFKTLGNPYASNLFVPVNNSVNQPITGLVFKWSKAKERIETIQKYQFQLANDALFTSIVQSDSTLTDTTKSLTGLNYLTKYYWRVRAQNQTGWGDWSEVWNTTTIIEKPANFALSAPANNSKGLLNPVTVTWNSSARADKYIFQVSTDSTFATFVVNDSAMTDTVKVLSTLTNYTQYYWRVKAVNIGGQSDWSEVWNFKTLGRPYASTLIQPVNNSVNHPLNNVVFKWTKARERIETIQKYQYQLSTDSLFASVVVNDTSLTDTTKSVSALSYLTKYYWRVRASNQTGWGDWSEAWRFTTIIEKPANFTLTAPANNGKGMLNPVTVSWNSSARAEKYILHVATDSLFASFVVNDSAQTDLTDILPTLSNYSQYYWRVKAVNTGGQSDWTPVWSFKTLGNPYASVLYSPANNSVNQPVAGLTFNWSKAIERIETIQKYQLQISTDSLFTTFALNDSTLTDTTKVMNGLSYLTRYHWRVRAQNQTGWGDWSESWVTTTIVEKPAITSLASPANNAMQLLQPVTLKWFKPLRADIYRLEISETSNFASLILVDSTLTDTLKVLPQLEVPKTYYWRVRSSNIGGVSDYSSVWNFRTLGKPLSVTLAAPANNSTHLPVAGVKLTWLKAGEQTMAPVGGRISRSFRNDDEASPSLLRSPSKETGNVSDGRLSGGQGIEGGESILGYWLQMTNDTSGAIYTISDSTLTDTFKLLPALNYLSSYFWRVKALNENGWGAFSGWYRFTTIIERPSQPLLASPANNALGLVQPVTLKWHSAHRAEKYVLEVSTTANFSAFVHRDTSLTDTSKLLPVLGVYTQHYWRVTAKNAGGTSDTSVVFSFKTLGTPAGVSLVTPAQNAQNVPAANVLFNWTKAYDRIETILGYRFELKTDTSQPGYIVLDSLLTDTTKTVAQLLNSTSYYWRVGAKNEAGWGEPTAWNKFTTIVAAPAQVMLLQPANNALSVSVRPQFKWNKVTGSERYLIEVSENQGFTSVVLCDSLVTDTVKTFTDSLLFNKKYYWRVKASNIGGQGSYSAVWNFTTLKRGITAPANLTAAATGVKKVTLSWTDKSDNESGFIIFRKQGDSVSTNTLTAIDTSSANSVQYIDTTVATDPLLFSYRIIAYNLDTISSPSNYAVVLTLTDVTDRTNGSLPEEYTIQQNYPNPFNPSTTIRYGLPYDSDVRLEIYDISGQKLQTLVSETQSAGYYEAVFDISGMSSGTYLYVLTATRLDGDGEFHQVKKMILLK